MPSVEDEIHSRFTCSKCGHTECLTKELAMTGTGLSKMFDIQHNYFLFVSCKHCGFTEVYNSNVLKGFGAKAINKKSGTLLYVFGLIELLLHVRMQHRPCFPVISTLFGGIKVLDGPDGDVP